MTNVSPNVIASQLDAGETLAPDTPADAIDAYIALALRREHLATRQTQYEEELARLHATGAMLQAEWEALETEQLACIETLRGLQLPAEEIITKTWTALRGHQALVGPPPPESPGARAQREHEAHVAWQLEQARKDEESCYAESALEGRGEEREK